MVFKEQKGDDNMALIKCPECGKEISERASACPHCGYPINHHSSQQRAEDYTPKKIMPPVWLRIIIVVTSFATIPLMIPWVRLFVPLLWLIVLIALEFAPKEKYSKTSCHILLALEGILTIVYFALTFLSQTFTSLNISD